MGNTHIFVSMTSKKTQKKHMLFQISVSLFKWWFLHIFPTKKSGILRKNPMDFPGWREASWSPFASPSCSWKLPTLLRWFRQKSRINLGKGIKILTIQKKTKKIRDVSRFFGLHSIKSPFKDQKTHTTVSWCFLVNRLWKVPVFCPVTGLANGRPPSVAPAASPPR